MPNVFGIADDIFVAQYDSNGKDHDATWFEEYYKDAGKST